MKDDKRMKVCFVSAFAYPLFNPDFKEAFGGGGAELQISLIAKELAKDDDWQVNLVVLDWGQPKIETRDGVILHAAYKRGRSLANLAKAVFGLFSTLIRISPDIVVCRAAGVEVGISAVYARLLGKKMVYSLAATMDLNGEAFKGLRGKIFRLGLFWSHALIAQTKDQIDMLGRYKALAKKPVALIKNSYSLSERTSEVERRFVLWVGRCSPEKRPELFLDLAQSFPGEKFVMIAPKNKPRLWEEISSRAGKMENLEFIEKVPFKDIGPYFRQAKVLVNTSTSEGFPNTFLQAAENGAAILSLSADPDGFLNARQAGIACGGDTAKLEASLRELLKDEGKRSSLAANSLAYLRTEHDIEKNIEEWKGFLSKTIFK